VREREAGQLKAKKSVRTEREVVVVPKHREEVEIERVRVEGEPRQQSGATEAQIGEQEEEEEEEEVIVQLFEEEVVITKRVVLKEEIRLRKKVVEEEEVVEVELRKEEVEIEDQTKPGSKGAVVERQAQVPPEREDY
jgi:uncharacterized protein (TIGR02271 family)